MAQTFMRTDGDIAAVLRTMFLAREFDAALGGKFKDPMRFVVSSVRFAYDGRTISNTRPMLNWLNGLGEAPFGRATPDGYPLTELAWASSGQMSRRFEIARAIGSGNAGLFDPEDGTPAAAAPADFRSSRTDCTSRRSSRFSARAHATRWIAPIRSRNGILSCCPHRISVMNEQRAIPMNRRQHCNAGCGAPRCRVRRRPPVSPRRRAGPRFLLVFLRGGYDSTNLLIPYSSSFYYEARPNIAIARPDPASTTGALALDADWALAPAVRDTIGAMYPQRQAAFIPFAGTDDLSRSHFETQDSIELGQPSGERAQLSLRLSRPPVRDLGRDRRRQLAPSPSPTRLPLAFEGAATVPNLSLKNRRQAALRRAPGATS